MGLDLVEILMEVEDSFGISIPENTPPVSTVGEFINIVETLLAEKGKRRCYSGYCFALLRRAIQSVSIIEKRKLRPSTLISDIVTDNERSKFYMKLRNALGDHKELLPEYEIDFQTEWLCFILPLCSCSAILWLPTLWWLGLVGGVVIILVADALAFHYSNRSGLFLKRVRFPRNCVTIGDVALSMSTRLSPDEMGGAIPLSTEVSKRVKQIIGDCAGIPPEEINDSDRLVDDLNLG